MGGLDVILDAELVKDVRYVYGRSAWAHVEPFGNLLVGGAQSEPVKNFEFAVGTYTGH